MGRRKNGGSDHHPPRNRYHIRLLISPDSCTLTSVLEFLQRLTWISLGTYRKQLADAIKSLSAAKDRRYVNDPAEALRSSFRFTHRHWLEGGARPKYFHSVVMLGGDERWEWEHGPNGRGQGRISIHVQRWIPARIPPGR